MQRSGKPFQNLKRKFGKQLSDQKPITFPKLSNLDGKSLALSIGYLKMFFYELHTHSSPKNLQDTHILKEYKILINYWHYNLVHSSNADKFCYIFIQLFIKKAFVNFHGKPQNNQFQ